jgi:hypothetical protein
LALDLDLAVAVAVILSAAQNLAPDLPLPQKIFLREPAQSPTTQINRRAYSDPRKHFPFFVIKPPANFFRL